MKPNISQAEFDKSKIYENLEFVPQPKGYSGRLPWVVQLQIAATNGKQYKDSVGKLDWYPQYNLPVPGVAKGLMLDIGTGWGRWLVAASNKGYTPVGIDLRLEFCKASLQTLKNQGKKGYVVAGDLQTLPFSNDVFDLIWSFSVIQHTAEERLDNCLNDIFRILKPDGFTLLEFPNSNGFRNKRGPAKKNRKLYDDINSWHVRYYTIEEYRKKFEKVFGNFNYHVHSFLGIGTLPEDLRYVSFKNKLACAVSLTATAVSKRFPFLKKQADSIYVKARKKESLRSGESNHELNEFKNRIGTVEFNNLDLVPLLRCPVGKGPLILSDNKEFLISENARLKYPVIDSIPILIASEALAV